MSPNPVTGAAAWSTAVAVDACALVVAVLVLAWDRWCPAGTGPCPSAAGRTSRDALVLIVLGAVLALVALLALARGRLLLAATQVALIAVLAVVAARATPAAFDRARAQLHLGITAAGIAFDR